MLVNPDKWANFMEKHTPHWKLPGVKLRVLAGKVRITTSAYAGAALLGLGRSEITATLLSLNHADFYKSMTTHADHKIWQDVYRPVTSAGPVYLKLTVLDDVLVVSFKEL